MRNYFFYILLICAFTNTYGKDEGKKKTSGKEPVKRTRDVFEQEAKTDLENLLASSIKNRYFGQEDDLKPFNEKLSRTNNLMKKIDNILKQSKSKKKNNKNLRTSAQINGDNFQRGIYLQNLPLYLKNAIESSSNLHSNTQLKNKVALPYGSTGIIKSRISGGHNVNTMLRNGVNYINIKPEVYPLLLTDDQTGNREISSEKDIVRINNQYLTTDEDELHNLVNIVETKHNNETFIRTASVPMSENYELEGLLNKLHIKHEQQHNNQQENNPTRKESNNNIIIDDFLNKLYIQSANHLRPSSRVENINYHLGELNNIDSKLRDYSRAILLRSDVLDNVNAKARLDQTMKYIEEYLRAPARHGDHRSRYRRSSGTYAGYTQDPDTCKTYNENLAKLWSNLSKFISTKDQPSDKALHNIAMMIQAYLEHQNANPPSETHKAKHEGPKDKISEIILKIRKLLDEAEGSAEKITKIILKYLKPDYRNESEDCQQVDEEYLTLSVDLLYKNYLDKTDCQEDDGVARNKKRILRQREVKTGKKKIGHMPLLLVNSELKADFQNPTIESKSYFYNGQIQQHKLLTKNRRVFKPNRHQRPRSAYRSGKQNEIENLNTRSKLKSKSTSKKHKKISLKSNVQKSRCEKYATRKLIVALRPVMERFMGLLECQLDNTLRSASFSRDSQNPYYLYASKLYSDEDSRRPRKVSLRLPVKKSARKRNKLHKKLHTERLRSSFENDPDAHARDHDDETDSTWVRKYSFEKTKSTDSKAHAKARDTNTRMSDNNNNKRHSKRDYDANNSDYFQLPPSYDDYDGMYKTHQNAYPSFINPLISLNHNKNAPSKTRSKKGAFSGKGDKHNYFEYDTDYEDSSISEEKHDALYTQIENTTKITPFIDLTKLRSDDQLIEDKNKIHVKSYESITEFLKTARDESMKTPEFAVPFALDTNKGYVELTHLVKYPKVLVYRPQFLVKNTMPYDDFLKTINNSNMTNDDVRLMKILRHLPNGSVQVLFETEDSEAPLEIRNLNDKDTRRSGSKDSLVDYQSKSRKDMASEITNADLTDGNREGFSPDYRNEERRQDLKSAVKSDSPISDEYFSTDLDLDTVSGRLRGNEQLSPNSYFDVNLDTNTTANSKPNSTESGLNWFNPLPSLVANQNHPNPEFGKEIGSAVGSHTGAGIQQELGPQIGSGMPMELDTASNLGFKLNPIHSSQLGSFFSKLKPSHSNAQAASNPSLNSQTHINSPFNSSPGPYSASNPYYHLNSHSGSWSNPSHSLLPNTDSNSQEVGKNFSTSAQSTLIQWWKKWKSIVKGKIKKVIGKMANLAKNIDRIVKP